VFDFGRIFANVAYLCVFVHMDELRYFGNGGEIQAAVLTIINGYKFKIKFILKIFIPGITGY